MVIKKEKIDIKPMVRLSKEEIKKKQAFIHNYMLASNPSDGSAVDANANVAKKTIATLGAELNKDINIQINRQTLYDKIEELYGTDTANEYIRLLEEHVLYKHDETSITPNMAYCLAITMYPFLEHGMTTLGGESKAPKHLESFCGSFINLCFAISSQFAGACAVPEMLLYFYYFAEKDYGKDFLKTHRELISSKMQHLVYSINQPAAARGYQSIFFNMSVYDRYFFDSMFGGFYFPDGTHIEYDDFNELQKFFMEWLRIERTQSVLTFPVLTEASLDWKNPETGNMEPKDKEWADFCAEERSKGLSFFSYNSDSVDALASCCRLRNELEENDFSYSLGFAGVETGSHSVMTINLNRFVCQTIEKMLRNKGILESNTQKLGIKNQTEREIFKAYISDNQKECEELILDELKSLVHLIHKFQYGHRTLVQEAIDAGIYSAYNAGYIHLDKQFSTIGINGLNEAAENLGYEVSNNDAYKKWVGTILGTLKTLNKLARKEFGCKYNTELVPAENLGVKNCKWDKKDGYYVGDRNCFNSYFYLPESSTTSILDKFALHGRELTSHCDGGSALHLNISNLPDKDTFLWLRYLASEYGCNYWTTNVKSTCCNSCGKIDFRTLDKCPHCGSTDLDYSTRIIGYNIKLSSYSSDRKLEEERRFYH